MAGRFGLTTRGRCVLVGGAAALVGGLVLGEQNVARAGLFAVVVPLIALLVVHRTPTMLDCERSLQPKRLAAGEVVVVHLRLTSRSRLPSGALMLEDKFDGSLGGRARFVIDSLSGREQRSVSYRIPDLPRGRHVCGPLRIRLTDPFGLVDVMRSFDETGQILVGPVVERLTGTDAPLSLDVGENAGSQSVGSHGADDTSTREYRVGDPLRKIHWRSTARTGALMVRQEERPWQGRGTVLLDLRALAHEGTQAPLRAPLSDGDALGCSGPECRGDSLGRSDARQARSLEWAISAAASIATHLLASRSVVSRQDVAIIDDPALARAVPIRDAIELRDHLAGVGAINASDLAGAGPAIMHAATDSTLLAILGMPDAVTVQTLVDARLHRPSTSGLAIILDTVTWGGAAASTGTGGPLDEAVRSLRSTGWRVVTARCGDLVSDVWRQLVLTPTAGTIR